MLSIRDLTYHVHDDGGDKDILKNVNLDVEDGRFIVITGPNGGGKTTLAKAIMGLVQNVTGSIVYQGQELIGLSVTERAKLGVSYAFQQPPRFKGLQVTELLSIAAGKKLSTADCCNYLTKVMRRYICSHTYCYTCCSVNKKVWKTAWKYGRFLLGFIKVRYKINRILIYIGKHFH